VGNDVSSAWIGVIGAVIGGGLTAGSNLVLETIRGRRRRRSAADERQMEGRQAARLVLEELADIESTVRHAVKDEVFWAVPRELPAATWNRYQPTLAVLFDAEPLSWRSISHAYREANDVNWTVSRRRQRALDGAMLADMTLSPEEGTQLRRLFRSTWQAIEVLEHVTGPWDGAGRAGYLSPEETEREVLGPDPAFPAS